MNRSYLEGGSIKTRQFSNSEPPVPPLPPQSVSDCKGFESHYPFKVITASLITAGHWSLQRLFAKAKFAGSDQQIHSMSVAPASSWVSRGKPQHLAARAPHGLKRLFVARCGKKKNIRCLITVLTVTGLYSFALFCLIQLPLTRSRETHRSCGKHRAEQEKESGAAPLTFRVTTGHFTINVYARLHRNLS